MELDRHGIGVHYSSSLALNIESEHLDNVLSQLDRHNHARQGAADCGEYCVAQMPIWQREKAAELAALKLVRNKLEEHVGSSCSLISIKNHCCSIILDNSATVGSLPFGVNPLTTPGKTCEGRKALLRDGRRRAASSNR